MNKFYYKKAWEYLNVEYYEIYYSNITIILQDK